VKNGSKEKAKQRVIRRESKRRAFVRQSFNAKITDPHNYDLIINTGKMRIESAIEAVIGPVMAALDRKK
jgi:cytidylate kinase